MSRVPTTTQQAVAPLTVKTLAKSPKMVTRFSEVLGSQDKANQFLASLISAVNGSSSLQKCNPQKVIGCAMIAASLNLDINANLGFASIVPYTRKWKDEAGKWHEEQIPQFQMGWKGIVQLAIRTNQYKTMQVTEVYADEFEKYDPFKGELVYHTVQDGDRANGRTENIVGYAFYFELVTGFSKMSYLSREEAENHAKRYSKAYQADLKNKTQNSPWSTMFDAMAQKTIVKNVLSKWGILSTQLVLAQRADQSSTTMNAEGEIGEFEYVDNEEDAPKAIPEENPAPQPEKKDVEPEPMQNGPESFDDAGDFYTKEPELEYPEEF